MRSQITNMSCSDIELFIEDGGDINAFQVYEHPIHQIDSTKYVLERAVELGCTQLIQTIIDKGATLNQKSPADFYIDIPVKNRLGRRKLLPLWIEDEEQLSGDCLLFIWSLFFQNLKVSQIIYDNLVLPYGDKIQRKTLLAAMLQVADIGNTEILQFLIARGDSFLINEGDRFNYTPFHYICIVGDVEMSQVCLEQGADPNIRSLDGNIPLIDAIHNNNEEVALLLLKHGADVHVQAPDRSKPLSLAKRRKLKNVVKAIEARFGSGQIE